MRLLLALTALIFCGLIEGRLEAAPIGFEGVAPANGVQFLSPYTEGDYTFTSTGPNSLFIDSVSPNHMLGNLTDSLGFYNAGSTTIVLTGPAQFDLSSIDIGKGVLGVGDVDLTIVGNFFGGGSTSVTYSGVSSKTTFLPGFSNLVSAIFTTSSSVNSAYVMFDNVIVTASPAAVPEPASAAFLGLGSLALVVRRLRRRSSVVA